MKPRPSKPAKTLYGPTIDYANGTTVAGEPLKVHAILAAFEKSEPDVRRAFLCAFAHDLTVAVRALLFARPVSESDIDKVQDLNESLHQLTSCANPGNQWSSYDQAAMLRAIVEASFAHGLDTWIGHALAVAAGSTVQARKSVAAM